MLSGGSGAELTLLSGSEAGGAEASEAEAGGAEAGGAEADGAEAGGAEAVERRQRSRGSGAERTLLSGAEAVELIDGDGDDSGADYDDWIDCSSSTVMAIGVRRRYYIIIRLIVILVKAIFWPDAALREESKPLCTPPLQDLHRAVHGKLTRRHPQRMVSQPDLQPQYLMVQEAYFLLPTLFCLSPSPRRWTWYGNFWFQSVSPYLARLVSCTQCMFIESMSIPCPSSWGWTKAKEKDSRIVGSYSDLVAIKPLGPLWLQIWLRYHALWVSSGQVTMHCPVSTSADEPEEDL
ncbi:hypothetical protein MSG28_005876 [Choristoneura fumiferana]|uniref:Uncharacterized protein n=1 Tax=Choristoneura fumiferana TaxID=7141 RepID=A0ACC0L1S4_CHOFU|nr:hypothetical protein MSG28_005876 [Choristoneura fumiferana]